MTLKSLVIVLTFTLTSPGVVAVGVAGAGWWAGQPQPYFASLPTNLTLVAGHTATLTCRVHALGRRQVTWMRVRDLHILTVGRLTYTADDRFQVVQSPGPGTEDWGDWTLHLSYTQPRDSGAYKCQVNSQPKIARTVYLTVTDESVLERQLQQSSQTDQGYRTRILGSRERFLQAGSSVWLVCVVEGWPPPPALLWYHHTSLLHPHQHKNRLTVKVEEGGGTATSKLHLHSVSMADSGNYSCLPVVGGSPASVTLHVSSDEPRAAVQLEGVSSGGRGWKTSKEGGVLLMLMLPLISLLLHLYLLLLPPPPHILS